MQNANSADNAAPERRRRAGFAFAFCIFYFAFFGCASNPPRRAESSTGALAQLGTDILAATHLPGVTRASWGIVVYSLDRNERLFELNQRSLFVPASVAKLVSVATAAEAVGWNYQFETSFRVTGPIVDGTVHGDLLVVGSGDPSTGGRGGNSLSDIAAALVGAGIRRIEGRVIGDDDAVEEPRPQLAWAWDDLGYSTGALFGALNLAENRTVVTVAPGPGDGSPTTLRPGGIASPPLINRTVTGPVGSPLLLWPEQRPGEPFLTIAGSIPAGAQPATIGIAAGNPTVWFARNLLAQLIESGIAVTGGARDIDEADPPPDRTNAALILTNRSPTLAEIARPLLKESINLYGEALLRLNVEKGAFPTNDAALAGLRTRLRSWGLSDDSYQLVDGSGLSRRDAISPDALLVVLRRMYDPAGTSPFMTALPIAGADGSLEARMKGTAAEGNVRAKTGTMSNIRSLAGYVTTRNGERLAFVIMVNNLEGTGAEAHGAIDAIAVRLAMFSR